MMNKNLFSVLFILILSCSVFALTTSDANYSGGVYNGGFELGTGSATSTNSNATIIGDRNYGWIASGSGGFQNKVDYNTTRFHSGLQSMKIDVNSLDTTDLAFFNTGAYPNSSLSYSAPQYNFVLKPSTTYKLSYWVDFNKQEWTQLTGTKFPDVRCLLTEYNSSGTRTANAISVHQTTTTGGQFVYVSINGTTTATSVKGIVSCGASPSVDSGTFSDGNIIAWFDDVRLEEVGSVNLTGQSTGRPSIVVTGVSDFNAIDQADTNNSNAASLGKTTTAYECQQFLPTQNKFTGFIFQKQSTGANLTADTNFQLRDNNGTTPSTNVLTQIQEPVATFIARPINTDTKVDLPYTLDANGTNKYWICLYNPSNNDTNFVNLNAGIGGYTSGLRKASANGTTWGSDSNDLYFKTLFEKQSSAFDLNVCSSGDTICDSKTYDINFLANDENYTITPANAPLFYSGDNNVYFMMHSDSNYQNTTPSMTALLSYTFDKPTTNFTQEQNPNSPNKQLITMSCTNGTTGNCINTLYNCGGGWYYYSIPFYAYPIDNTSCTYYSTADNNNTESSTTTTITYYTATNFQNNMCEKAINIPNSLWLVVLIILIILIIIVVTALKDPMGLTTSFLSDNVAYLVPIAILIALVIFIGILFVLMGGVICATVV